MLRGLKEEGYKMMETIMHVWKQHLLKGKDIERLMPIQLSCKEENRIVDDIRREY